jgi:hypothetical protein
MPSKQSTARNRRLHAVMGLPIKTNLRSAHIAKDGAEDASLTGDDGLLQCAEHGSCDPPRSDGHAENGRCQHTGTLTGQGHLMPEHNWTTPRDAAER